MTRDHKTMGAATSALVALLAQGLLAQTSWQVESPSDRVAIRLRLGVPGRTADYPVAQKRLYYDVTCRGETVVALSPLGITRSDQDFIDGLEYVKATGTNTVDETYTIPHGKRKVYQTRGKEKIVTFRNARGAKLEIVLRAYDDGVAFRYRFPEESETAHTVTGEATGFQLPAGGQIWAHPYDQPGQYTPAYETYYSSGVRVGTASSSPAGWAFPILFCNANKTRWGLLTEAAVDGAYCGIHLQQNAPHGVYRVQFPLPGEGNGAGASEPSWTLPWATPWRVVVVGETPGVVVESTLVTDLNPPSIVEDTSWIKPGRASWSWLSDHDSPQDHDRLKPFIDLAAEMGWEYCLIDANWNIMKNGTIHDLIAYADSKGVGLLLWYNSGGPHNYVTEQPRGTMNLRQVRRFEFRRLRDWGIKGVKVDFFQSDKQNVMQLYHDILCDAADFQIMVNFHGCTLPRGWSRAYPHLMSMEAVRGAECYSFDRTFSAQAPQHNTILPFTRNAVGPMDYTPVIFSSYRHITTYAHELALPIIFESGWLHFGDGVRGYQDLPAAPKAFLKDIPVAWDETRFLAGEPGKSVMLARRDGETWYVAGINGLGTPQEVLVPLPFLGSRQYDVMYLGDGDSSSSFETRKLRVAAGASLGANMAANGGFVAVLTPVQ
ncbi:MAG: glycoside hydrolase family 97 catalytic domain-containing protein [Sedimentisphaerales bacterium]|nr:glycoside hydrolase family 97 catalytic domain-containing protein [Sedimentisphaerales bacterium]